MYVCTLLVNFQDFFTCHSAKIYLVTRTTHQHDGETPSLHCLVSLGMHIWGKNERTALEIPQGLEHCLVSLGMHI